MALTTDTARRPCVELELRIPERWVLLALHHNKRVLLQIHVVPDRLRLLLLRGDCKGSTKRHAGGRPRGKSSNNDEEVKGRKDEETESVACDGKAAPRKPRASRENRKWEGTRTWATSLVVPRLSATRRTWRWPRHGLRLRRPGVLLLRPVRIGKGAGVPSPLVLAVINHDSWLLVPNALLRPAISTVLGPRRAPASRTALPHDCWVFSLACAFAAPLSSLCVLRSLQPRAGWPRSQSC